MIMAITTTRIFNVVELSATGYLLFIITGGGL
jgi:hypothetical protein